MGVVRPGRAFQLKMGITGSIASVEGREITLRDGSQLKIEVLLRGFYVECSMRI